MPTQVLIPPLGQTVDTLTFVSWYKQEGEAVQQGEPLFVVETDKATLDVEAPVSGVLVRVTAQPGDQVAALSVVAAIAATEEIRGDQRRSGELREAPGSTQSSSDLLRVPLTSPSLRRPLASPRARRLAEQMGVALAAVTGTGSEGVIVERDVRAYLDSQQAEPRALEAPRAIVTPVARRMAEEAGLDWRTLAGSGPRGQVTRHDVEAALAQVSPVSPVPSSAISDALDTLPLRGVRALIAERMMASHSQTAPVTLTAEVDATELVEVRRRLAEQGVVASYHDLLIAILARALREHPRLNASLDGDAIRLWRRIDIGLAVDTDRGLLAPVVRNAAQKGLAQLAEETRDLAERARGGKIMPDELRGSTFTLTNLGMYGVDAFTPIINLPETAILGVGRIKERAAIVDGQVVVRQQVWLSLTFDHRLVDGGLAARFLQRVTQLIEFPVLLLT